MQTKTQAAGSTNSRPANGSGGARPDVLKAVRDRLAFGIRPEKPKFEYECLAMFVQNELGAAATMPALSIIFSLASMFWAPVNDAVLWLLLVIAAKVLLLEMCRRFAAIPRAQVDVRSWKRRFLVVELINGVVWAGFALVGFTQQAHLAGSEIFSSHVFMFATLIVVLAIRMTFTATVSDLFYVGTIPVTLAVTARLLALNDPFYFALASMAVGVHVYFLFLAKGLKATAETMLEYRAQKDALIAELEEQKSFSDDARRRSDAANKAKSRFLATMSHELRTPLNAIMGFSEVMKDQILGPITNPTYCEYATNIYDSGNHLLHVINEILDLSRIEAGRYEMQESALHLTSISEDCERMLKMRIQNKGLTFVQDYEPGLAQVWADERSVRQICINLLSNALKFTPRGGTITVRVAATENGGQVFSVKDNGPGIPADELPKVMEAFGQGSLTHQTAEGGTGLGLPIVRSLIELHGGEFELHSSCAKGPRQLSISHQGGF